MSEPLDLSFSGMTHPVSELSECLDDYFALVVGTPSVEDRFKQELTGWVKSVPAEETDLRYDQLAIGADVIAKRGMMQAYDARYPNKYFNGDYGHAEGLMAVARNSTTGVRIVVDGIRAVGETYEQFASAPQERAFVDTNVTRMVGAMYGLACADTISSTKSVDAYTAGINPRSKAVYVFGIARIIRELSGNRVPLVSPDSLAVTEDLDGQLDIRLRHKRRERYSEHQCPAVDARVDTAAGSKKSLYRFLRVIGDVAATSIYPAHTEIV